MNGHKLLEHDRKTVWVNQVWDFNQLRIIMRYSVIRYVFRGLILTICSAAILLGQDSSATDPIVQLEKRIKQLEEAVQAENKTGSLPAADDSKAGEVEELRRQIAVLAAEVEKLRSGAAEAEVSAEKARSIGLSSSAASIYRKSHGVSIAGYGEMLYQNFADETQSGIASGKRSQLDFLRAILYAGYRFNDKFVFNSEIEFEHANTDHGGEVSVEFAYLDYMINRNFTLRGGLVLIPMGITNEFHEPTAFLGARRSETETHIIPTTWRENGVGILGSAGKFSYRAYLVAGLNASGFSADGIRSGRQSGAKSIATDMAFVGRLEYAPKPGISIGGSIFSGNSGQGQYAENGSTYGIRTTLGEIHGQVQMRGFDIAALYARSAIADVADLNRLRGISGSNSIGKMLQGGYVHASYNLLSQRSESMRLSPYYRFERLNSQAEVPQGYASDPARDRSYHTAGIELRPIPNIAVKADYQWIRNGAQSGTNQFNINMGYSF